MNDEKSLREQVAEVATSFQELQDWGRLVLTIPCVYRTNTREESLKEIGMGPMDMYSRKSEFFSVDFKLELVPNDEKIRIRFHHDGTAEFDSTNLGREKRSEIARDFYGFRGSWEQVILKMVELNNLIIKVPKFFFILNRKEALLHRLKNYCKKFDPSWRFLEGIVERLIEAFAQNNYQTCKLSITEEELDEFDMSSDCIMVLGDVLRGIEIPVKSIQVSSQKIITLVV